MKSRIASALAVLACVGALAACSGKGSAGTGGSAPAGAGVTATSTAPGGAAAGASSAGTVGSTDSHGVADDPDGDLNSLDQQLSDIDGALSSAEPTQTAGDNG
ncbi:hypothetical protein ABIA35_000333 [Catenulispora sp. MAP12-49]|uniref:hypothetical protein n=1 Tax=unclassified Catenulispora TaxID=414885 RepID=UPI003514206E